MYWWYLPTVLLRKPVDGCSLGENKDGNDDDDDGGDGGDKIICILCCVIFLRGRRNGKLTTL